jgi:hypothetical protein
LWSGKGESGPLSKEKKEIQNNTHTKIERRCKPLVDRRSERRWSQYCSLIMLTVFWARSGPAPWLIDTVLYWERRCGGEGHGENWKKKRWQPENSFFLTRQGTSHSVTKLFKKLEERNCWLIGRR